MKKVQAESLSISDESPVDTVVVKKENEKVEGADND